MFNWLIEFVDQGGLFTFGVIVTIFAVLAIMIDMAKRELPGAPALEPAPSVAPLSMRSRTARYELWRKELKAWTDNDGTQAGLNALLDRWYGVSHEKPANKVEAMAWDLEDIGLMAPDKPKEESKFTFKDSSVPLATKDWKDPFYNTTDDCYCGCPPALDIPGCKCPCHPREIAWRKNVFEVVPPFKVGQWVRVKRSDPIYAEDLVKVEAYPLEFGSVLVSSVNGGRPVLRASDCEPALPRAGEWWRKIKTCAIQGESVPLEPHQIPPSGPCGRCVYEPVNFGRGEGEKR